MRAWNRAMGGQAPRVILTDHDNALKETIAAVFPDCHHCYCLWNILSKIPEKLSHIMRQHETFMAKINKCIYKSLTEQQFEKRWWKIVEAFNLRNHTWFQSIYEDRTQWMPTFMRDICFAGLSTSQRSDNSFFVDKHVQRRTTLNEFLGQYKVILREKYEEEAKADLETRRKQPGIKSPSPFGKQMATLYTHAIFKKFQVEVLGMIACHPKKDARDGTSVNFKIQDFEQNQDFFVVWNETTLNITCSCHSFECYGFLCRHAMIVLQMSGQHSIPSRYILKRWTKDAKARETLGQGSGVLESQAQRYDKICQWAFRLGDEGSLSQESYTVALNALEEALQKCENVNDSIQSGIKPSCPPSHGLHGNNEVNQGNTTSNAIRKDSTSKKGKEQLNLRAPAFDGNFGSQQVMQGTGQLSSIAPIRDDYFSNRQNMLVLLNNSHYVVRQRPHGLFHVKPQSIESFDIQDGLREQDMDHNLEPTQLHVIASKCLHPKHLS